MTLANSIAAVVEHHVNPLLERLVALERAMNNGTASVDVAAWLMEEASGSRRIDGLLAAWFQPEDFVENRTEIRDGLRHSLSGSWRHTTQLKRIVASNARRLANDDVLVKVDVEVDGEASYDDDVFEDGVLYQGSSWEQPHGVEAELQLLVVEGGQRIADAEVGCAQLTG